MKRLIVAALAALSLTACDKIVKQEAEYRNYEIVDVKPPKRLYVTLKDVKTGFQTRVYVSKRCSRWREIELHSETALMTTWYTYESGETSKHINVNSICPR